jgi:hypothetical protein
MWPSGAVASAAGAIPARPAAVAGRGGRGVVQGCPRPSLGGWSGWTRRRRRGAVVAGVGGHWSPGSGELSVVPREWAAHTTLRDPSGGAGGVDRQ